MVTTSGGTMSGNAQGLVLKGTTFHISETYGSNPFNLQVSLSSNGKTIIFDTSYSYTFSVSYLAIE